MKSNNLLSIAIHIVIIISIQILLFLNLSFTIFDKYSLVLFIVPLTVMILPISYPKATVLTIAFIIGLFIDYFYQSLGLHASSLVLIAFARPYILSVIEPRGGYRTDKTLSSSSYGMSWFLSYSAILLILYLLVYFSLDAFSLVYIDKILVNALLSFIASYVVVCTYQFVVRA